MTRTHLIYIIYERARKNIDAKNLSCANLKKIMMTQLANFGLKQLRLDLSPLYETGFLGAGSAQLVEDAYKQTLIDMRPQMIPLSELVPEGFMPSTIGNYYGDIYENQFETAQNSRLNRNGVPELVHTHIKPVMALNPAPKL
mmetsp:Transcript_27127/g.33702  ORF Transcript_27127/g.33702 Transcript_27127/m.33702 type:complete len:142 (+) Transcript_27127:1698-2123(+)